jgi:hypothetical protein
MTEGVKDLYTSAHALIKKQTKIHSTLLINFCFKKISSKKKTSIYYEKYIYIFSKCLLEMLQRWIFFLNLIFL